MKRALPLFCLLMSLSPTFSVVALPNDTKPATQETLSKPQEKSMDAIQIILKDHEHIKQMMGQLKGKLDSNYDESRTLFGKLKAFILKHETMEETIFYPELNKNNNLKSLVDSVIKEEKKAGEMIKEIDKITDKAEWVTKVKELMKAVEHHATDEETKLFPKVKKEFDQKTLDEIGSKMQEFRAKNDMNAQ
jgi:hemerythrin superfamily protein